jgi:hypothetical protein
MSEKILLVLVAAGCSMGAWAFWHLLGNEAMATLAILALVSVTADNIRLRRKLRAYASDSADGRADEDR